MSHGDPTVLSPRGARAKVKLVIYFGECCREWPLAFGHPVGRCGLCGEKPTFKRWGTEDEQ